MEKGKKQQLVLKGVQVHVSSEVNGLEMGVLSDGTAYLSGRALSKLCDVANSSIVDATADWASGKRTSKLSQWLMERGLSRDSLYVKTSKPGVAGNFVNAYTDDVVNLIVEYYAFEAPIPSKVARENYRVLNRAGIRTFVYTALGYNPTPSAVPAEWRQFHDRLLLVSAPVGYFCVFKETADLVLATIRTGLPADVNTVLDISIGQAWALHWKTNGLEVKYGARQKHSHNYPDYFPQAKSNPQDMNVYPVAALPEFRTWLQTEYVPMRFPAYLNTKIAAGVLPPSAAELVIAAGTPRLPAHDASG